MRLLLSLAILLLGSGVRAESQRRDLSEHQRERLACSTAAALKFGIPVNVMLAVAEIEGGRPGQWVRNRNGSLDVGPLQFNTRYLAHLERQYGITAADVAAGGCYPYELAAWRLRRHLERDRGDSWTRIANYHSRSPAENSKYRAKLMRKAKTWSRRSARFATYEVSGAPSATREPSKRQRKGAHGGNIPASATRGREAYSNDSDDMTALLDLLENADSDATGHRSRSIGSAHGGSIEDALQLPSHVGYAVRKRSRAWGTSSTIDWLVHAFDAFIARDPSAPRVRVHDLSFRRGGRMNGHKSHQSGRDVDITYYQHGCRGECEGRRVAPADLDAARQWRLLRYWLERDQAEFVFIDYALQRPLYESAKVTGASPAQLARWFQYPRGPEFPAGIIRHVPNHANHVHVRFRCATKGRICQGAATRLRGDESPTSPLLDLIEDESEDQGLLELLE